MPSLQSLLILALGCTVPLVSAAYANIDLEVWTGNNCDGNGHSTNIIRKGTFGDFGTGCTVVTTQTAKAIQIAGAHDINDGVSTCKLDLYTTANCAGSPETGIGGIKTNQYNQVCYRPLNAIKAAILNCQ